MKKLLLAWGLCLMCSSFVQGQIPFERIEQMPDSILADQWMGLAQQEWEKKRLTNALRYSLQALNYLEKQRDFPKLYRAYVHIGQIYQSERLHTKALEYFHLARRVPIDAKEDQSLSKMFAVSYSSTNQIDSAAFFLGQILDHYQEKKDTNNIVKTYQDIVDLHNKANQYTEALALNQKILTLLEAENNPRQIAAIYNNIGFDYNSLKDYDESIEYFLEASKISKKNKLKGLDAIYTNIAIAYQNSGNAQKSLDYLQLALRNIPFSEKQKRLETENLISSLYFYEDDLYNAQQYNGSVINSGVAKQHPELLSEGYLIAARIHEGLYEFEQALSFYQKHLEIKDSLRLAELIRQQELLQQQVLLERAEKEIKLLMVNQEVKDLQINQLELAKDKLQLESEQQEKELELLRKEKEIELANTRAKELDIARAKQALELSNQRLLSQQQESKIIRLQQQEQEQELQLAKQRLDLAAKEAAESEKVREIDQLKSQREIDQLKLQKDDNFRRFVYGLLGMLGLILTLILGGLLYFRKSSQTLSRQNQQIEAQKSEIESQRNQSDQLLLNILPAETAQELKEKGTATPRKYKMVTVLFSDFSGFTGISANMTPEMLIEELNTCFRAFDEIIERHHLEKIKTIGDAYMCAGGIPVPNNSNPADAIAASLEMNQFMEQRILAKAKAGEPYWEMRIGIHTGPCIAGVVGKNKFAYDIWGDTVNTASRMETNGLIGKINISEETYLLIKDQFDCEFRGEVDVRHKGKIKMYFVNGVA
ncbi:MAG: adenylate/guanylate cyclase domain-containing protein [Bacteroidota bacterium]